MRHVDDAHDAEGDGEANGRQQQHRAEREPVPEVLRAGPEREIVLDLGGGRARGGEHVGRQVRRQTVEQRQRILVAAIADDGDGRDLVGRARIRLAENDGGARFVQRFLDAGVFFSGERLLERRQRAFGARFEHGLRRFKAFVRIGRHQCEAAECGVDDIAQAVVDDDGVDIVGRRAGYVLAGGGVGELAGFGLDEDLLVLGAELQPGFRQRLQQGGGERAAAFGDLGDGLGGIAERAFGESGKRVLVGPGMGQPREGEDKAEGAYERPYAIAEITHGNQTPASTLFLFGGGGFTRRLRRNPPLDSASHADARD